ncbi:unnamed protein product, partial [Choristocarpus tenellus]
VFADDADIVSKTQGGLARTITVLVKMGRSFGLNWSYKQTDKPVYLGETVSDNIAITAEISWRIQRAWSWFGKCIQVLYDRTLHVSLELKMRMLNVGLLEVILYGYMTSTL